MSMAKKKDVEVTVDLRRWYFLIALRSFEQWVEFYRGATGDTITADEALRVLARLEQGIGHG